MTTTRRKYLFGLFKVSKHHNDNWFQFEYYVFGKSVLCINYDEYHGWFRLFGKGLKWKQLDKHPKMFSERNGLSKYIVINNWLIGYLS